MLFSTACGDFCATDSPAIVSEASNSAYAQHFHRVMAKQFNEMKSTLAAEFEQALADCLELQRQNDALRAKMSMQVQTGNWHAADSHGFSATRPEKAGRSKLRMHPGDWALAETLGNESPRTHLLTTGSAIESRNVDKRVTLVEDDIIVTFGESIKPALESSRRDGLHPGQKVAFFQSPQPCTVGSSPESQPMILESNSRSFSGISSDRTNTLEKDNAPECAFVINVRRLVDVHQFLVLLHELLKTTAIAAITLVAAGSKRQFTGTMVFISAIIMLSSMHEADWDRLDVEDLTKLLPLLCNDIDPNFDGENPNRILKAVTISTNPLSKWIWHLCHLVLGVGAVIGWITLEYYWREPFGELGAGRKLEDDVRQSFVELVIGDGEDAMSMAMQLMVGSLMYLLEILFAYIHWRETVAVMPKTASNEAWDPRRHGVPMRYWLMGLPSMWFTSEETLRRLKMFIDMANPGRKAVSIYPQEFAYYALSGDSEREELQNTFRDAKLFDACRQCIVNDAHGGAEALNVGLCFFDAKRQRASFPYPGDFQYFVDEAADQGTDGISSKMSTTSKGSRMSVSPIPASHKAARKHAKQTLQRGFSWMTGGHGEGSSSQN